MSNVTPKFDKIKLVDWMTPRQSDSIDDFFLMLSDNGIDVATSVDELLADDDEDATTNLKQIAIDLVFYGRWLLAKADAFEELKEIGFKGVKAQANYCESLKVQNDDGFGFFEGEWCQSNGVIYATYGGKIEVASASEAKTKRGRESDDRKTANLLLLGLYRTLADEAKAA